MTRFCTQCGQAVPDNCSFCTNCGAPLTGAQPQYQFNFGAPQQQQPVGPKPNNYMVWSILATIFCCLPLGVWSIVCSSRVNKEWDRGNYVGANNESKKARTWIIISAILGLIANAAYVFKSGLLDQL